MAIGTALMFNLVSSLLVWHPDGKMFNIHPMTIAEWVYDIITVIGYCTGFATTLFDVNEDTRNKIKETFLEANEGLKKDKDRVFEVVRY